MAALAWPFFGYLAVMAPMVIHVLYGDQWNAAIPLIQIMCISSALYSIFSMARYLFVAMGAVKAQAQLDTIAVPLRVVAVALAASFGLQWVAWAVVLGAAFRSAVTYRYLLRLTGVSGRELLSALRGSALVAALSIAGPLAVRLAIGLTLPVSSSTMALSLVLAVASAILLWLLAVLWFKHEFSA